MTHRRRRRIILLYAIACPYTHTHTRTHVHVHAFARAPRPESTLRNRRGGTRLRRGGLLGRRSRRGDGGGAPPGATSFAARRTISRARVRTCAYYDITGRSRKRVGGEQTMLSSQIRKLKLKTSVENLHVFLITYLKTWKRFKTIVSTINVFEKRRFVYDVHAHTHTHMLLLLFCIGS